MDLKGKNVLLIGLAKTGISTIKLLDKLEANITVNDIKTEEKLVDILEELKDIKNTEYILGYHPQNVDHIDLAVVSPGVPLDLPFILKLKEDIHADIKEQESIILFVYDDIKVFEKSRTYKVELKELIKEKK